MKSLSRGFRSLVALALCVAASAFAFAGPPDPLPAGIINAHYSTGTAAPLPALMQHQGMIQVKGGHHKAKKSAKSACYQCTESAAGLMRASLDAMTPNYPAQPAGKGGGKKGGGGKGKIMASSPGEGDEGSGEPTTIRRLLT